MERDPDSFDLGVKKIWTSILSAAAQSGDAGAIAESIDFHAARPFWYVRNYRFKWWQWLFWPVTCSKISFYRRQLANQIVGSSDHSRLLNTIDIALGELEFAGCPLTTQDRWLIRRKILELQLSNAEVRNAFRSFALRWKNGQPIQIKKQPKLLYWCCRVGRDMSASVVAFSLIALLWLLANNACSPCAWTGYILLSEYALIFWMLFQFIGPSWAKAQQTLQQFSVINK